MKSVSVEAGRAKSSTLVLLSSFLISCLDTWESEQMQTAWIGLEACWHQERNVCPNKAMEGTRKRTSPLLLVSFSAIFNEVKVLPVPQAIMSLPLSWFFKYSWVFSMAFFWCSNIVNGAGREVFPYNPCSNFSQSTLSLSNSIKLSRVTGGVWFLILSSAVEFHLLVVEIQSLCEKWMLPWSVSNDFPDVDRNVSTSGFVIYLSSA